MSPGVPDVNYSLDDGTCHGWLELKIGAPGRYPFKRIRHGLRPAQVLFIDACAQRHTLVVIVAYVAPTIAVWRDLTRRQLDAFNTWDVETLKKHANLWENRRLVQCINIDLLRPATRQK
jgi:hypothetical protein